MTVRSKKLSLRIFKNLHRTDNNSIYLLKSVASSNNRINTGFKKYLHIQCSSTGVNHKDRPLCQTFWQSTT